MITIRYLLLLGSLIFLSKFGGCRQQHSVLPSVKDRLKITIRDLRGNWERVEKRSKRIIRIRILPPRLLPYKLPPNFIPPKSYPRPPLSPESPDYRHRPSYDTQPIYPYQPFPPPSPSHQNQLPHFPPRSSPTTPGSTSLQFQTNRPLNTPRRNPYRYSDYSRKPYPNSLRGGYREPSNGRYNSNSVPRYPYTLRGRSASYNPSDMFDESQNDFIEYEFENRNAPFDPIPSSDQSRLTKTIPLTPSPTSHIINPHEPPQSPDASSLISSASEPSTPSRVKRSPQFYPIPVLYPGNPYPIPVGFQYFRTMEEKLYATFSLVGPRLCYPSAKQPSTTQTIGIRPGKMVTCVRLVVAKVPFNKKDEKPKKKHKKKKKKKYWETQDGARKKEVEDEKDNDDDDDDDDEDDEDDD